ncbi:cell division protein SepF [Anaerosalibacter massiliensis]|uniref:Cell division protein SepF n=1 Tax=Anaerosalibacter massiliensis TaxID=1347392 RepID=A0A9X2MFC2_9FIRM|nr:cell division protein SepF [Anaerosalibacter massiliensis]MCR2042551.1 cell division protein SepF [Anaerosalibacter massiliensis]
MADMLNKFKYFMGLEDLDEEYDDEDYEDYEEELERSQQMRVNNNVVSIHNNVNMKLVVHEPLNYEDAPSIIEDLKMRKAAVVNLEQLETDCKRQVFDFINGGLYALEGNIHKVTKDVFILAPKNVEIDGYLKEDFENKGLFSW